MRTSIRLPALIREVGDKYIYDDAEADATGSGNCTWLMFATLSAQMIMPAPRTRMSSLSAARQELELEASNLPQMDAGTEGGSGRGNVATYSTECSTGPNRDYDGAGKRKPTRFRQ